MNAPSHSRILRRSLTLLWLGLLWRCAAIQAPPGGPKDTEPPQLVSVDPPNESTGVTTHRFRFQFSEYLLEESLTDGIQVFPRMDPPPEVQYEEDGFQIYLPGDYRPNQTYVLTLTRNIRDEHQVPLAEDIQYAFSTGAAIDHGSIRGRVYSRKPAAVHVWKTDSLRDSVYFTFPDYVRLCREDGSFQLGYLSPGGYVLLAVEKTGAGMPLKPASVAYGLPHRLLIRVDSAAVGPFHLRLQKDPVPLYALEATRFSGWTEIRFNRKPVPLPDIRSMDQVPVPAVPDPRDSLQILLTGNPPDTLLIAYRDSHTQQLSLPATPARDTTAVQLRSPDTPLRLSPEKGKGPAVDLIFSKPLAPLSPADLPLVYRSADTTLFETLVSQTSPVTVTIRPFTDWEPGSRYFIRARGERLLALDSTRYQDSLLVVQITTGSAVHYGSLSGAWQSVDSVRVGLHLEAVEKPGKYLEKVVNSWSEFHFTEIPEGAYLLSIFIDRDASQAYTYGSVNPPQPAEYFWYLADTLHIRANWETELSPIVIQEP